MTESLPIRLDKGMPEEKLPKKRLPPEEVLPDRFQAAYEDYARELDEGNAKSGTGGLEKELLRISSWPEFKRTTVKKCKKVFGRKVCINWPQLWKREARLSVFVVVRYPEEFEKDVKECLATALTGAVLALLASGSFAGAWELFLTLLEACLSAKGADAIGKVGGKFELRKVVRKWKKV